MKEFVIIEINPINSEHLSGCLQSPFRNPLSLFIPTVEKPLKHYNDTSELPFITEHPFSVILSGRQAKIPWIVGFNSEEGLATTGGLFPSHHLANPA